MAYMNIYEQSPLIVNQFSVIKNIANDLDLTSAFNKSLVEQVENNVDNTDSLLRIMSSTYRDVGLVGQETVGDVAVRQFDGGNYRVVKNLNLMVHFVSFFQTTKY